MTLLTHRRPHRAALHSVDPLPAGTTLPSSPDAAVAPGTLRAFVLQDRAANAGRPDSQAVLALFRFGQWAHRHWGRPGRVLSLGAMIVSSVGFGVELPSRCQIGPGLRLYHPHSIVLNPGVRMGADCQLRHNTTLGNIVDRDGTERGNPVLGDGVDLGAGCAVLGPITVGDHARVGSLAVVTKDVPAWAVVVGNPAKVLRIDAPPAPLARRAAAGDALPPAVGDALPAGG